MTEHVLDASAVLAWLQNEPGADVVDPLRATSATSAANWSEVLQKVSHKGCDPRETGGLLLTLGLEVVPMTGEDAALTAALWAEIPHLSLANRCCLALASRLGVPAVTADGSWQGRAISVMIVSIR